MACKCGDTPKSKVGVCDVCRIVDGDLSPKEVQYCDFCKAWICKRCESNIPKRALAAAMQKILGR